MFSTATRGALVYGIRVGPLSYLLSREIRLRIPRNVVNKSTIRKNAKNKKFCSGLGPMRNKTVKNNERIQNGQTGVPPKIHVVSDFTPRHFLHVLNENSPLQYGHANSSSGLFIQSVKLMSSSNSSSQCGHKPLTLSLLVERPAKMTPSAKSNRSRLTNRGTLYEG